MKQYEPKFETEPLSQDILSENNQRVLKREWHIHRVVVIQTAFIGDVILTTPLLRRIKDVFPETAIDVLLHSRTVDLLKGNPYIRQVISYDKRGTERGLLPFLRLSKRLHRAHYDAAFLPHRSMRSALLTCLAGISLRIGFNGSPGSFLYTHVIPYRHELHETERNLQLLSPFSADSADPTPYIFIDQAMLPRAQDILRRHRLDDVPVIVGMAPGSVWPTKRWLPGGFAAVADRLIAEHRAGVILFGGPEDRALCTEITSKMKHNPLNMSGALSLRASAALMTKCRVFVSNDTGIMHLAAAMKVPVVAIFGATVPSLGFAPVGRNHTIVEKQLRCRPCGVHGGKRCAEKTFDCMKQVRPTEVYEAIVKYL